MHIHLPKPLHGWREFVGEVGIIVLGVLIALGAEQLVEARHWHQEVRELQDGLNRELSQNLVAFHYRAMQEPCVAQRLAELGRWQAVLKSGGKAQLAGEVGRPALDTMNAAVWNARSSEAVAHMASADRIRYSRFYDEMATVQRLLLDEREAWSSLNAFNGASGPLSGDAALHLSELLYRVGSIDHVLQLNWRATLPEAAKMGLHPNLDPATDDLPPPLSGAFCHPLGVPAS